MSEPFIAEIRIFAGNFAPRGWAFCNGQLLPIAQNTALFSLIGTIYGGDGRTTVGLPNLQGRAPMHAGRGPGLTDRRLGGSAGVETVTLSEAQMPAHTHTLRGSQAPADQDDPSSDTVVAQPVGPTIYAPSANLTPMANQALPAAGGSQAHSNLQPFLVMNFIIALVGLFPTRS
jgi:microcystin-dependent protein